MAVVSMTNAAKVFAHLKTAGIKYTNYLHNPVMTCADKIDVEIPALATKNLFLKDNKGGYWLVSALDDTRVDLKTLAKTLSVKSLRFGNEEPLMEYLGVKPGAVSMFGLINDEKKMVRPLIDEKIMKHDTTRFHPLQNDQTTVIATKDLIKFFESLKREYRILPEGELS